MNIFHPEKNVFDVLEDDHNEAKLLMEKIADTQSDEEVGRLFAELNQKLTAHVDAEEAVFYPRLRDEEETRALILEANTEHNLARQMLRELEVNEVDELQNA